jgi:hypothetical protein
VTRFLCARTAQHGNLGNPQPEFLCSLMLRSNYANCAQDRICNSFCVAMFNSGLGLRVSMAPLGKAHDKTAAGGAPAAVCAALVRIAARSGSAAAGALV